MTATTIKPRVTIDSHDRVDVEYGDVCWCFVYTVTHYERAQSERWDAPESDAVVVWDYDEVERIDDEGSTYPDIIPQDVFEAADEYVHAHYMRRLGGGW